MIAVFKALTPDGDDEMFVLEQFEFKHRFLLIQTDDV